LIPKKLINNLKSIIDQDIYIMNETDDEPHWDGVIKVNKKRKSPFTPLDGTSTHGPAFSVDDNHAWINGILNRHKPVVDRYFGMIYFVLFCCIFV
jgi:hypothetical protein